MNRIEIRPTSPSTAACEPIVLRTNASDTIRLVFKPQLVRNEANPAAAVDGDLVYERKTASSRWQELAAERLNKLKTGQGVRIFLHANELLGLYKELGNLYDLHQQQGIPRRKKTYIPVESEIANFLAVGETELRQFLDSHEDNGADTLLKLIGWLAQSSQGPQAARRLITIAPERVNEFTSLLGLASLKDAVAFFKQHSDEAREEFWQRALSSRSFVFHQVFAYPIVLIEQKAYVGGKQIDNKGGYIADYLGRVESTNAVVIVEIKTPQTLLLGKEYRKGIYAPSSDVSGAVTQVLRYRQTFVQEFHSIRGDRQLTAAEPSCLVVAGNSAELDTEPKKDCFELQRQRLQGVTVITFDELFGKIGKLIGLLEQGTLNGRRTSSS